MANKLNYKRMKLNGNYTGSQKNDLFSNDVGECKTIMKIIMLCISWQRRHRLSRKYVVARSEILEIHISNILDKFCCANTLELKSIYMTTKKHSFLWTFLEVYCSLRNYSCFIRLAHFSVGKRRKQLFTCFRFWLLSKKNRICLT